MSAAKKKSEQELRISHERIKALNRFNKSIIDGISDEVIVIDSVTRKILSANRQVLKRTGMKQSELLNKKCYEIYYHSKRKCESCPIQKTFDTRKKAEGEITLFDKKDNKTVYLDISTHPIVDSEGNISRVVHISRNITARKKYEEKLAQLNDKILMLFNTSTQLQESLDLDECLETAVRTFESLGYDRVRIYFMEDNKLVGMKSNHIDDKDFPKLVVPFDDEHRKAYTCVIAGKPIIEKAVKSSGFAKILGKTGLFESASLPLLSKNKCQGMISLDNKFSKKPILKEELNILMTFANQIAVALENAMLHRKDVLQLNKLRAIYDISSTIISTLDFDKLLNMIVIRIVKLLKADLCSVLLLDETKKLLVPCSSFDIKNISGKQEDVVDVNSSVSGVARKTDKIVEVSSIEDDKRFQYKKYAKKAELKSMLTVPLSIEGTPTGVLNIYTRKHRIFTVNERELLKGLANHTAMIIKNSRLYERIKLDKDNFSALVEISQAINSTLDTHDLLEQVLDKTVQFTNADFGFIMLIKDDYFEVKLCKKYRMSNIKDLRIKIGQGIPGFVAKHKKAEIVSDVRKDNRYIKISDKIRSMAAIPLLHKNEVIGVLDLESSKMDNFKFFKKSLDILTNHIAIAIENARLYDKIKNFNVRLKDEIRLATQELREKNIELQKLDELKSDFVSNVSHELRTPLTSISGYTKLMLMKKLGQLNEKQLQSLNIVSKETDRLTRLINEVLDLSKLEAGKVEVKFEKVDITKVAREVIDTLKMDAKDKNIKLNLNVKIKRTLVEAGRDLIKQVYINLINNALKFTPSGGRISIIIRKNKKNIEIAVEDTGKGIPKSHIPKLFNKFVQVDGSMTREQSGTGLGLVIVKYILDLHNGNIDVKSEPGRGSVFTFSVPLKQDSTEKKPVKSKTGAETKPNAAVYGSQLPQALEN